MTLFDFTRWKSFLARALCLTALLGCDPFDHPLQPEVIQLNQRDRPAWYDREKLGIFIHWGPYAVPGLGEWYRFNMEYDPYTARYHRETYGENYPYEAFGFEWADIMNNRNRWDPDAWAELFFKAGAGYVVLTTKHHDGFLLWPSETPNPHIQGWQLERDVVGELAQAVRDRGLRFGVYYSGGHDWTFRFPLGPGPIRQLQVHLNNDQERIYIESHYRELIRRYGPSVLWNDISYPTGDDFAFKWRMQKDYYKAVPEGVVNDRFLDSSFIQRPLDRNPWLYDLLDWLLGHGQIAKMSLKAGRGVGLDRNTKEIPDINEILSEYNPPHHDFITMEWAEFSGVDPRKWERDRTLGWAWGYDRREEAEDLLTGAELIHLLVDVVSKNGNLLINVGPTAEGIIPEIQQVPLRALGEWLAVNGEAVYNTRPWERAEGLTGSGIPVRFTQNPWTHKVYAIVLGELSGDHVLLKAFAPDPVQVTLLGAGPCPGWYQEGDDLRIPLPENLPDQEAHAFEITRFVQAFLPAVPQGKEWELVWHDEFSAETLDESKWSHACKDPCPRRDGYWTGDAAYLDGKGQLVMEVYEQDGSYFDGAVHTQGKFEHTFGYVEARVKLHQDEGHWPAFWLMTDGVGSIGDEGRDGTEIDIMEKPWAGGLLKYVTNHAMHWDGYGPESGSAAHISFTPGIMEGYHTYGLWWSSDEYIFYIDGREVWRTDAGGVSQVPEYLMLTDEIGHSFFLMGRIEEARLPDFWYVDYVRVYDLVDE